MKLQVFEESKSFVEQPAKASKTVKSYPSNGSEKGEEKMSEKKMRIYQNGAWREVVVQGVDFAARIKEFMRENPTVTEVSTVTGYRF